MKSFINQVFNQLGYQIQAYNFFRSHEMRRAKFLKDHDISLVLDIGANQGQYAQSIRALGYKNRIISFEPIRSEFQKLKKQAHLDQLWQVRQEAIGHYNGQTEIHISKFSQASSILPATGIAGTQYFKSQNKETVSIYQLDSLRENLKLENEKIYLKLDTQGFEKKILEGALKLLNQNAFTFMEIEISVQTFYQGETLLIEMLNYLQEMKFQLISTNPTFIDPKTGYVLQHDCIFINKNLL